MLKITRVVANPPGPDRALDSKGRRLGKFIGLNKEYIEIKNQSIVPVDLTGFVLTDATGKHRFVFPKIKLGGLQYIRIRTGSGANTRANLHWNKKKHVWNNRGDTALLYDSAGRIISQKTTGQLAKVSGKVTDIDTKRGLADATVATKFKSTKTSSSGNYSLSLVRGPHQLTASKEEYKSKTKNIVITSSNKTVNFELEKSQNGEGTIHMRVCNKVLPTKAMEWKRHYKVTAMLENDGSLPILEFFYRFDECEKGKDWAQIYADSSSTKRRVGDIWSVDASAFQNWKWYTTDWKGAHRNKVEKAFSYRIFYAGKRRALVPFDYEATEILGNVKVKVEKKKLDALDDYNVAYAVAIGSAVIGGLVGLWTGGAGAAIGIIGAIAASAAMISAQNEMDDPPSFDPDFKKVAKPKDKKLKIELRDRPLKLLKNLSESLLSYYSKQEALMITNNRLWTARLKRDKSAISKQKEAKRKLLTNIKANKIKIIKLYKEAKKEFGNKLAVKRGDFLEFRRKVSKKGLPRTCINILKQADYSKKQILDIKEAVLKLNISKIELDLINGFGKISKTL